MNVKAVLLSLILVFSFVGVNSLGRFYLDEPIVRGKTFEGMFIVRNPTNHDMDNVNVKFYIPEIGVRLISDEFDVDDKYHNLAIIDWYVPKNTRPGKYLAKISVGNDYFTDVKYVYVNVV